MSARALACETYGPPTERRPRAAQDDNPTVRAAMDTDRVALVILNRSHSIDPPGPPGARRSVLVTTRPAPERLVLDLCAADPGPNAFGGIDQRLTCSFRQRACIHALDRGGQLVHQTVRLTLTQQAFRDQSSNVVHEEVNGILRSKRCPID